MALLPWSSELQRPRERIDLARRIDRFLLCVTGCPETRRLTLIVWGCTALFLAVDVAWLSQSVLRFERANWNILAAILLIATLLRAVAVLAPANIRMADRRRTVILRGLIRRCELLCHHGLLLVLLVTVFVVFTYLVTAAALPLQDRWLASIDRRLGFDWPAFLAATNRSPLVAATLTAAYHSTATLLVAIVVWLSLAGHEARLAELLAALSLTFAGLAVGMIAVPSAGAFAWFALSPDAFANFAARHDMWRFHETFAALRDGSMTVIAISSADGIVSFPSFHAALGVVTAWALRGFSWLLWPVAALNAVMMVAVLPVGGHHLSELIGGAVVGMAAIALTQACRRPA